MLKLTLNQEEYLTIGGIVVQVTRIGGSQVELAIQADRSIPIVRGEVLERQGGERPACLCDQRPAKSRKAARRAAPAVSPAKRVAVGEEKQRNE